MAKYDALQHWLERQDKERIRTTFEELDGVVGGLPRSARTHQAWWQGSADGSPVHVQKQAWHAAGYTVETLDLTRERVTFLRID